MSFLNVEAGWPGPHEGAVVGVLSLHQAAKVKQSPALEEQRIAIEAGLRKQFKSREDISQSPAIQAYKNYYKGFGKSYHVQGQLESVALKGKSIPNFNPIVEAMFMAELNNQLLTAGHDLEKLELPLKLGLAEGTESYQLMSGQEQMLKAEDMFVADEQGILSSIIYGPDQRSKITGASRNLLFVVYGVPGIGAEAVQAHLDEIAENIGLFSPELERGELILAQR